MCLLVLAAAAAPHTWAWFHWHEAKACLAQARPQDARRHLQACLRVWPNRVAIHLLAARAARQAGAFDEAEHHFAAIRRLQPKESDDVLLEWALQCAAQGDLAPVESYLRPRMRHGAEEGPLVCEALAEGYLRNYRGPEALTVLDVWQEQHPDHPRLLTLRGDVWRHAEALGKAAECYQRVLELDPERDDARHWLALCLLDGGRAAEALPHWEQLRGRHPEDVETLVHLARCQYQLGQSDRARRLLEDVLIRHPDHVVALRSLGDILFQDNRLTEAERVVCRALAVAPWDYKSNDLLARILQQQGRSVEAESFREKTRRLEARWKQFRKAARDMADRPHDPALQCEAAAALLDLGYDDLSLRWLLNAVHIEPQCRRGHELLARWYEKHQDAERADYHREQARALPSQPPTDR
ncbi:MAG TPA: tetratricopeptide repeat protein [Gemmataceae bacterium]|nr:tetratricopeptide repeat protein [Gemmataceae bacterium]